MGTLYSIPFILLLITDFINSRIAESPAKGEAMPRPKKPTCKKCQALEKRARFWRDLAGRYKASIDQIYGDQRLSKKNASG
jgi:hypothetical protein